MALLFCDGCDSYASNAEVADKWNNVVTYGYSATGGRYGGGAITNTSTPYTSGVGKTLNIAAAYTFYVAFWFKCTALPSGINSESGVLITAMPETTINTVLLGCNASGNLCLQGLTSAAIVTGPNICDGNWHWVECSFNINASGAASSSSTCYVDGVQAWTGTTYTFNPFSGTSLLAFGSTYGFGSSGVVSYDDLIIWDTTGSSFNTFPLGPRRIATLNPSAAGASTQFTPSSGANYAAVSQAYSGTAYVQDAGSGNTDLYATPGMAYTPLSVINAAVVNVFGINPSGSGSRAITPKLRSGATPTVASGSSQLLGSTAANYQAPFYADALGTAWTQTTINAAQPGIGD
jgi:hypothetical protein